MAKKTRLTVGERSLIKAAILQDIPQVDYETIVQDYLNKRAKEQLPLELQKDCYQEYLGTKYLRSIGVIVTNTQFVLTEEDNKFLKQQSELESEQESKYRAVRSSLNALLNGFNYVEDFVAAAPEFAKYVAKQNEPVVNLPAIQLKETLASLGWPKPDEGK